MGSLHWNDIAEKSCKDAVEIAEKYVDGLASFEDVLEMGTEAEKIAWPTLSGPCPYTADFVASQVPRIIFGNRGQQYSSWVCGMVHQVVLKNAPNQFAMDQMNQKLEAAGVLFFRDLLGNPFRPTLIGCSSSRVAEICSDIYDHGRFDRMPQVADALIQAGCRDEDVLAHCQNQVTHVRGCWVLDLILQRERHAAEG